MKEKLSWRILLIVGISAALLLTAAAPFPARASGTTLLATSNLVRLTLDNRTDGTISVTLFGESVYRLIAGPGEVEVYTVQPGTYEKWVSACGNFVKEEDFEITRHTRMIMPVCGANAHQAAKSETTIDLSEQIKIVPITVENNSRTNLLAILTGPGTYVFTFEKGQEKDYTVIRGTYSVKYYACGKSATRSFHADKNKVLELKCPH